MKAAGHLFHRMSKKSGFAPGALVHVGDKKVEKPSITLFDFDDERLTERRIDNIEECFPLKDSKSVTWIDIDGLHDIALMRNIGKEFGLHSLVQEDILNTHQRPKIDYYDDYVFIVLKMISYDEVGDEVRIEQVSVVLGKHFVLTFQERPGDVFDGVRERIRKSKGKVRNETCGYLAYALLDSVVDSYFFVLDRISEKIERLEEVAVRNPSPGDLREIHKLKNGMTFLRRSIWPLREIVGSLVRDGSKLIEERLDPYLRDLYDHTLQATDAIDTFRDLLSGLLDVYLSSASNRMNEIMKVLTIFASIFIPLTFVAGLYGMNFHNMPELRWKYGYPVTLAVMALLTSVMLYYFKRKGWLWRKNRKGA